MMNVEEAYNNWAGQYDTNINKTRDLEAIALREMLSALQFESCLEIGCGTGKNTVHLVSKAQRVVAVDFSAEMLNKARQKNKTDRVVFHQADITKEWEFATQHFDLIVFSLVLEHIENLDPVFKKALNVLKPEGYIYIGELHPFKQYSGSKARFDTPEGQQIVTCFNHHISDFTNTVRDLGLKIETIKEYFDGDDRNSVPRILALLLKK